MLVFIRDVGKNAAAAMNPGRSVGGLLLMHTIYVASNLSIVPQQIRLYLKDCLEWIGMYMGIGQASLFAKVRISDFGPETCMLPFINDVFDCVIGSRNLQTVFY